MDELQAKRKTYLLDYKTVNNRQPEKIRTFFSNIIILFVYLSVCTAHFENFAHELNGRRNDDVISWTGCDYLTGGNRALQVLLKCGTEAAENTVGSNVH